MRIFIVLGHSAVTTPNFNLDDLPGSGGRIDILCRCVNSAFCLSHDIRRDVLLYLVLQDRVTIRFVGNRLKHLNPDERSTGALIRKALKAKAGGKVSERESTPGIFVSNRGLARLLDEVEKMVDQVTLLHEDGEPMRRAELTKDIAFVLSDHLEFEDWELELLEDVPRLSVGPKTLHADHCIIIAHNELDLRYDFNPC